jgi:DNA repair exonuclease SbcCD ATPase subunit
MVAPAIDNPPATSSTPRGEDPVLSRLNRVVQRLDEVLEDNRETRTRIERLEMRFDEGSERQQRAMEQLERNVEEKLGGRIGESVKSIMQPELATFRPPIEAQAARLAAVESRLERVETIQVESMNALDSRFTDLAYQTRLALSAGGLISLAAIMVVLLR